MAQEIYVAGIYLVYLIFMTLGLANTRPINTN